LIRSSARKTDFVGRYGGEEFCMLLIETGIENGLIFAERLRKRIAEENIFLRGYTSPLRLTVSIGLSERSLEDADKALYIAKSRGRNRVVTL